LLGRRATWQISTYSKYSGGGKEGGRGAEGSEEITGHDREGGLLAKKGALWSLGSTRFANRVWVD